MASGAEQGAPRWPGQLVLLTGAVAELKAQVRASEVVDGDGKLEELRPARTVVVVENKTAVVHDARFTATLDDAVLQGAAESPRETQQRDREKEGEREERIKKKEGKMEEKEAEGKEKVEEKKQGEEVKVKEVKFEEMVVEKRDKEEEKVEKLKEVK